MTTGGSPRLSNCDISVESDTATQQSCITTNGSIKSPEKKKPRPTPRQMHQDDESDEMEYTANDLPEATSKVTDQTGVQYTISRPSDESENG
jgi:hypothetical protein